ncbi:phage holin family protein [Cohnella sp. CFH 77786]|uniref:phage holin family protein n=1 Tax=Cohnella sp. CFH 77786 TaxID=2662265 RepID=UPI001C60E1EC|nr:phage holin family protein [Cohnella sp. CFH 77786]MBW5446951.1 phage holin family protein [Cohnella sp. CFH 77786]
MNFIGHVVRFIVSAIVLMVVGWLVPNFTVGGFWSALLLALVIALFGWILEGIFGKKITPFGRGIVGFLASALVIWLAQFVVGGVRATIIGAILAALVIGIVDLFIPVANPFRAGKENHARS